MMHFAHGIKVAKTTKANLHISTSHACGASKQGSAPLSASQKRTSSAPAAIGRGKDEAGQVPVVVAARPLTPQARDQKDWNPLNSPGAEDWQVGSTIDGRAVFSSFPGSSGSPKGVVVQFMDQKW